MKGYIVLHRILSGTVLNLIFLSELAKKALQVPRMVLTPLTENSSALDMSVRSSSGRANWQWAGSYRQPWEQRAKKQVPPGPELEIRVSHSPSRSHTGSCGPWQKISWTMTQGQNLKRILSSPAHAQEYYFWSRSVLAAVPISREFSTAFRLKSFKWVWRGFQMYWWSAFD